MSSLGQRSREFWASIGIIVAGAMWGLFWIPLRAISEIGLTDAWPGAVVALGTMIVLLPYVMLRRHSMLRQWRQIALAGMVTGSAFSLYASGLLLTDVVRGILLFYITPVWGTLLGILFLGERLTLSRIAALTCGLGGLAVILGDTGGWPWPRNIGDWLALASGFTWACGSLLLFRLGTIGVAGQMLAFVTGSLIVSIATILILGETYGPRPAPAALGSGLLWGIAAALYFVPMLFLTIWPTTVVPPARIGILMMSDVVVGVVSAALLSGEPFTMREAIGAALIMLASLIEIRSRQQITPLSPAEAK